jgi:hypothetical protein
MSLLILRLTYRRNSPNNSVKILINNLSKGKLFNLRDLWDIDGEGICAEKSNGSEVPQDWTSWAEGVFS